MQRFMVYFLTGSFESSENRLLSRAALNEGCLFRGSLDNIYQERQSLWITIILSQNCQNVSADSIFSEKREALSKR